MSSIEQLRRQIDQVDSRLLALLAERMRLSAEIGRLKQAEGVPLLQQERFNQHLADLRQEAARLHLPADMIDNLWQTLHRYSLRRQEEQR